MNVINLALFGIFLGFLVLVLGVVGQSRYNNRNRRRVKIDLVP